MKRPPSVERTLLYRAESSNRVRRPKRPAAVLALGFVRLQHYGKARAADVDSTALVAKRQIGAVLRIKVFGKALQIPKMRSIKSEGDSPPICSVFPARNF